MKKSNVKIGLMAIMMVIGTLSLSAQIGRGGTCLGGGTFINTPGTCVNSDLTAEQQAALQELFVEYQAAMDVLRTEMRSTFSLTDKLIIRQEMVDLRNAHLADVNEILGKS